MDKLVKPEELEELELVDELLLELWLVEELLLVLPTDSLLEDVFSKLSLLVLLEETEELLELDREVLLELETEELLELEELWLELELELLNSL